MSGSQTLEVEPSDTPSVQRSCKRGGYFRVPLATMASIVEASPDPDVLAAWLVLRRFAYGEHRELTAAGAKRIAGSLSITRPRASRLIGELLAIRYGTRGDTAALWTAQDWNATTGRDEPVMRGNAPVYVMPNPGGPQAYLSDLLVPPGDFTRSYLAGLCELDAQLGLDALRLLVAANHSTSCGDFVGADPAQFACNNWQIAGESGDYQLGHIGISGKRHYWLVRESEQASATWAAILALSGGRDPEHVARYWAALSVLTTRGLLYRVAIVSDARGRLQYPLWIYGESHRLRLESIGIRGNLASAFHRQATRAGFETAQDLASDVVMNGESRVFVCASSTGAKPEIRTLYATTFLAPTPDNLAGMEAVSRLEQNWE